MYIFNCIYKTFGEHLIFFNTNDENNIPVINIGDDPPPNYIVSNTNILPPEYTP